MNAVAAKIAAETLLRGAFDGLDAALSKSFSFEPQPAEEATASAVAEILGAPGALLQAQAAGGRGSLALVLPAGAASTIAALAAEKTPEAKDSLDDTDMEALRSLAEPVLGGGVAAFFSRFGGESVSVEEIEVSAASPDAAAALLGEDATATSFTFDDGEGLTGNAVILIAAAFEAMVPPDAADGGSAALPEANLSPEEVGEILSGYDVDAGAAGGGPPRNLNMVMDILLDATARLGRVEMSIADILRLGPGSVIEVGHLVDEPVELLINNKLVARGDVVVVDEKFGLRITEIVSQRERIASLG